MAKGRCQYRKKIQKEKDGCLCCELKKGRKIYFVNGKCQATDCSLR